mmetsp:Transcript_25514/g.77512  ORF Transcript_25514/g.77512 Transcript_25514/m.77512 type:complete len:94 (+) Transcript_25514:401-682(+)|eukprot:scaffold24891_cov32-Tisochrysis_lutea.AAC.2
MLSLALFVRGSSHGRGRPPLPIASQYLMARLLAHGCSGTSASRGTLRIVTGNIHGAWKTAAAVTVRLEQHSCVGWVRDGREETRPSDPENETF